MNTMLMVLILLGMGFGLMILGFALFVSTKVNDYLEAFNKIFGSGGR